MKSSTLIIIISLLTFNLTLIAGESPKINEFVKCEISVKQKSMKAGATGELLISLKPKDGIHINLDPPLTLKLDSSVAYSLVGKPIFSKTNKSEYIDIAKPIKQSFTLSKKIKPGLVQLKGTLSYFYCSGSDGWCARFKQPIDISVKVIQ